MIRSLALIAISAVCFAGAVRAEDKPDNSKKLVGKWKITEVGDKEGGLAKDLDLILEFKADGSGVATIEATDPKAQEFVKKLNENPPKFKWTVTGDKVELVSTGKKGEGLFGNKEKATAAIKFDGDKLTMTPDDEKDKVVKLVKVKK